MWHSAQKNRNVQRLFLLCWAVYFTSYLGRMNFSALMSEIMDAGILTAAGAGAVNMAYLLAYGIGQLVNGLLGDRVRPGRMIFIGLLTAGVCNFCMAAARTGAWMVLFWCGNGYAQSMLWPPIMRLFAEELPPERRVRASVDIVSSMALGSLASYLVSAAALQRGAPAAAFWLPAAALCLMACIWHLCIRRIARRAAPAPQQAARARQQSLLPALPAACLLLLFPVMVHGGLKDGLTGWIPTYFHERFAVSASFSAMVTMLLPIVNLSGAYMAEWANRRLHGSEIRAAGVFFGAAAAALGALELAGRYSLILSLLLFAAITSSMLAVNALFINLLPLRFAGQGRVATISGALNAIAYLGSAACTGVMGLLLDRLGWSLVMGGWIALTAAAWVVCLGCARLPFAKEAPPQGGQKERTDLE